MLKEDITPALLREFLDYEPTTGKLFWKPRDRKHFADLRGCRSWNGEFPGTEALTADNGSGYMTGIIARHKFRAHRVAWAIYYGEWPDGHIDHINHDRRDNRISNLRLVTKAENAKNQRRRRDNTSGRTGVRWHEPTKKWIAHGPIDGRATHLGLFETFEAACERRAEYERAHGYHENHGT